MLVIEENTGIKIYRKNMGNNTFETLLIDEENKKFEKNIIQTAEDVYLSGDLKHDYSILEKIKLCFSWKIKNENLNGIECLVITDENDETSYYNKENAYLIKQSNMGEIVNVVLNSVDENDIQLPNLEGFTEF